MDKILVPIDFSKSSEYACKMAAKIAEKSGSKVCLLHVIELPSGMADMGSRSSYTIPESMLYLRKIRDRIFDFKNQFFSKSQDVQHAIRFQNPYEGILACAEKINADLIVMGSKGHSNFDEIFIGSNTEKVVRTAKKPVLVVKKDNEKFKFKNLVFASSFKNEDKKEVLRKLIEFATIFDSKIHLLKVITPSNFESTFEAKEKIKTFVEEFTLPKHSITIYNDISIEKGILNFLQEINADLIALSTHGRSGLSHLFSSSVTKNLSKNALKPMLTIRV
ncbi:MAG: universal stress protein [Flavobacteriia bacterium]|nr:universal stress protein [Flavobacteriia bacterium]OIP47900.1 MAG: universal stress protein [Flavobacteriaceae bacterium CG2_30_31_66]PIV97263.1 MAG: universal stress protein [Flavobacteriaceae bacterium CG17_big_fil_post_rev_8_21_14_2_50_31_13]PIX13759.1 MAG: universal stress protein [Flavobacteriaceae bacterium CG_4_8_14_3_um_filter_31_8]PIY15448.1 MAG: universal stress protein [Flavobacteriaceae bacterium CG_4_10_14_3_um_filter_31_253]PIZ12332.1 MAG: universal stress protein [Flavobacter